MELKHRRETMDLIMQAHDATERRMHMRMDEMHKMVDEMDRQLRHADTRNKTLVSVITVAWILFSAGFSWLWERATNNVETYTLRIQELSDQSIKANAAMANLQADVTSLKSIRGQVATLQEDVTALQVRK
jgi:chaperonin cofactor prefoldin